MKGLIFYCAAFFFSVNSFAEACTESAIEELQLMTPSELHEKFCGDAGFFDLYMTHHELLGNPRDLVNAKQCLAVMNRIKLVYRAKTGETLVSTANCQASQPKAQ